MNDIDQKINSQRKTIQNTIIACTTILAISVSFYFLSSGTFIVFQNLFYIPIILSCMYYTFRGFIYSVCLALLYVMLILFFTSEINIIMQALIRAVLFIVIALIVTFLSTMRKQAEEVTKKYSNDLNERIKELNCLYSISEIVRRNDLSREKILQECVYILSQAYQFPEIAACRITWGDQEYKTENFRITEWLQGRAIMLRGEQIGNIEICYLEERQEIYEGPFLVEERKLLNSVADLLGRSSERKQAEEEREKLIIELKEALAKVKTLSGFLPICAWCKKIRDDRGYWNQIESYIRDHSEAEFSHSICPECMEKLYPENDNKK